MIKWKRLARVTLPLMIGLFTARPMALHAQTASTENEPIYFYCSPDIYDGFARCNTETGDNYLGYLQNGKPHGRGVYVYADGNRYEGEWLNGLPHGEGRFVFSDDSRYEGQFYQGAITNGSAIYASGDRYTGTFQRVQYVGTDVISSQPGGTGTLIFANGNRYEGEFFSGEPFGLGKFTHSTGTICRGYFLNRNFDSQEATCTYSNGSSYRGELRFARPHGTGTMTRPDGTRVSGAFRDGQPVNFSGY